MLTRNPARLCHIAARALLQRLPTQCALCGDPGEAGLALCGPCRAELPWNTYACGRCAEPVPHASARYCARCLRKPPAFDAAWAPLLYAEPVDQLITAMKFHGRLAYAQLLGAVIARQPPAGRVDRVVPVPLHRSRLRARGYNQAAELARAVAKELDVPLDWRAVQRTRNTAAQSGLPARARRANVRGAFAPARRFDGECVAIFDDVITTGDTASELARTVKRAGARRVLAWACARAPRPRR